MLLRQCLRRAAGAGLLVSLAFSGVRASADAPLPFLCPLFTDNMVLQRGMSDAVWGWATPGTAVAVHFQGRTAGAVAGADGKWTTKIGPFPAGGPYTLTVAGAAVKTVTIKNVMVGDVWLCSGQSNMEFGVSDLDHPAQTIAAANDPNLRLFTVRQGTAAAPAALTAGQWQVCTPETVQKEGTSRGFSAVAFFFGQKLRRDLHVPLGLIQSSWGGTPAEAWISEAALRSSAPEFSPQLDALNTARDDPGALARQTAAWIARNDPGTPAQWQAPAQDDSLWETLHAPGSFQDSGLADLRGINGVVWYRKTFDLPPGSAGRDAVLHLLADDSDTTWVNGVRVGATDGYTAPRAYPVPAEALKPSGNVVAVRVLDTGGAGGLWGEPAGLNLTVGGETVPLAGEWRVKRGVSLADAPPLPVPAGSGPTLPAALFNVRVNPLVPFGLKGVLWYQGESNNGRDRQYRRLLPALIGDWRARWGEGNFPFLLVQLAGYGPGGEGFAKLRDAQWRTALRVPHTGIATAVDLGEPEDIHPKNKAEVGRRLALTAEAKAYGLAVVYAGPVFRALSVSGASVVLRFTHTEGGLVSRSGPALTGFEIAGPDGAFVPAEAHLSGEAVVVSAPSVPAPQSVRYAWAGYPSCSLYNGAGLPAFPFRTGEK